MQWLIGTLALVVAIALAIRFAQSRRTILGTVAIFILLAAAAGGFYYFEMQRSAERDDATRSVIKPGDVDITDAAFAYAYGNWRLRGTLVNQSEHRLTGLTLHVTVQDCPDPQSCETVGENDTATDALDIAPRGTHRLDMLVSLPDMPMPRAMKWSYEVTEVRSRRE